MDTNMTDDDHWFYKISQEVKPEDWDFFQQPSGLSAEAENLDWLNQTPETMALPLGHPDRRARGRQYYERLVAGKADIWVKVYVKAQWGATSDGRPVFPEFNENIHVSREPLSPYAGLPLYLCFDFGLTPACAICQVSSTGQFRVLDEITTPHPDTMGLQQFVDNMLKPFLSGKYPGYKIISLHDPAGVQRSQANEITCRQILRSSKLNPSAVSTNLFTPRRESVAYFLTRLISGEPAFLMSPTCKKLRKALNGDYKYMRVNVPGEDRYKDVPDKNQYSHIAEALGYGTIHFHNPGRPPKQTGGPRPPQYRPAQSAGY
jgi:hypothetical protein